MSRKPFVVTPAIRDKVRTLAAVGTPQDTIAAIIRCSPKTLRRHFKHDLAVARAEATAAVGGYLYKNAQNGNVVAQIFWMKCQGAWSTAFPMVPETEIDKIAEEEANDPPPPPPNLVHVYIPDNGRDPEIMRKRHEEAARFARMRLEWIRRQKLREERRKKRGRRTSPPKKPH